jgi:polar amino acid transport system substrate-binding protein
VVSGWRHKWTADARRNRRALASFFVVVSYLGLATWTDGAQAQVQALAQAQVGPVPEEPPAATDKRVVLRVVTEGDYPPFNYFDEEGVLTGFNVDLARALCLELNVTCDIQVKAWEALLPAAAKGEADAVIAGHIVSSKALKSVDFTDRYFHTAARFSGRREGDKPEITPDGVEGRRIGIVKGTVHEAYLSEFFRLGRLVAFETPELARDALMQKSVDLLFDDGISLALWLNGTASKECCELRGGPFLEPRFFGDGLAIAVPKSDPQLRGQLNSALKRVRASGRFDELVLQYFRTRLY